MKKLLKLSSVLSLTLFFFSCEKSNEGFVSNENQNFLSSVAIIDKTDLNSSKTEEALTAYTLELKNFNEKYQLNDTYKIDDIEYTDNGQNNDLIANDGIYTSVELFEITSKSSKNISVKIAYSEDFKYKDQIRNYTKEFLASNKELQENAGIGIGVSITCDIVTRPCPQTTWYNSCWFTDECTCIYLENCSVTVGVGFE